MIFTSVLGFAALTVNGCDAIYWNESASLEKVNQKSEITVLALNNPLIYSTDRTGHKFGIDHDLLESFGRHYSLKIKFVSFNDEIEMKKALAAGEGDIAVGRLATSAHSKKFLVGPSYEETFLSLFCKAKSKVAHVSDLNDKKIALLSKDDVEGVRARLRKLAPQTQIQVITNSSPKVLFEKMSRDEVNCIITENLEGEFFTRYHRNIEKVTSLTEDYALSWLVRRDQTDLNSLLQAWFQNASRNDEIMRVHDRYKLYLSELDRKDVLRFMKQTRRVLPEFESEFRDAAEEHRLPWQLVAAVSYQESHWNNEAVSYTGVKGLMQLTQDTADHLGVEDRTDPLQSIWGGAKYLRYLLNKTPYYLNFKDRLYLALAAYNLGYGHLRDAQKLAEKKGKNPYSWRHLRSVLPLLEDPSYESDLEYGAARGHEAVEFAERVMGFYSLMVATHQ